MNDDNKKNDIGNGTFWKFPSLSFGPGAAVAGGRYLGRGSGQQRICTITDQNKTAYFGDNIAS